MRAPYSCSVPIEEGVEK